MNSAINVFIIYAREDKEIKRRLLAHLNPFVRSYDLVLWHDEHLEAGQEWKSHIESRLEQTDLFLLLVSVDFMNSEFINQVEFKFAIDRHKANKSIVIPIIINYCQWDIDFNFNEYYFNLNELQVLPQEGKPIDDWKTPEQAYNNIAAGIRKVLDTIKGKKLAEEKLKMDTEKNEAEDKSIVPWEKDKVVLAEEKKDNILSEKTSINDETNTVQTANAFVTYDDTVTEKKAVFWTERKDIIGTLILLGAVLVIYLVATCNNNSNTGNTENTVADSIETAQTTPDKNEKFDTSKKDVPISNKLPKFNSPDENKIFTKVEVEAGFSGGEDAWRNYLRENLNANVPVDNRSPAGKYTVIVKFIVSKDGRLSEVMCENNPGYGMCEEAVRVIKHSPMWTPAIQNGRYVNAYRRQPLTFVIEK